MMTYKARKQMHSLGCGLSPVSLALCSYCLRLVTASQRMLLFVIPSDWCLSGLTILLADIPELTSVSFTG